MRRLTTHPIFLVYALGATLLLTGYTYLHAPAMTDALLVGTALLFICFLLGLNLCQHHRARVTDQRLANLAAATSMSNFDRAQDAQVQDALQNESSTPGIIASAHLRLCRTASNLEENDPLYLLKDPATGLPNQAGFDQSVTANLNKQGVICLFRLTNLTELNSLIGSSAVDRYIAIASTTLTALSEPEIVARITSNEFACLLVGYDTDAARRLIAKPERSLLRTTPLRWRIGIAQGCVHGLLQNNAKLANSFAKREDLELYVYDHQLRDTVARTHAFLDEVKSTTFGGLSLYWQPQYSSATHTLTGLEVLSRYKHSVHGVMSPADFIPMLANEGLMYDFDLAVVDSALSRFARVQQRFNAGLTVSVNVSVLSLSQTTFADALLASVKQHNISPATLCIEITETEVLRSTELLIHTINQLARAGIRVSLDDFGTGYSTLKNLTDLCVHEVKIDRYFVRAMDTDVGRRFVESMSNLAFVVTDRVVVEGIETHEQFAHFQNEDRNFILQGFLFSKPIPTARLLSSAGARQVTDACHLAADYGLKANTA